MHDEKKDKHITDDTNSTKENTWKNIQNVKLNKNVCLSISIFNRIV